MLLMAFVNRHSEGTSDDDMSSSGCHTVSWTHQDRAIRIIDETEFLEKVLPQFMLHTPRLDSFIRKLYRWGFRKCQLKGKLHVPSTTKNEIREDDLVYWNPNFVRNKRELIHKIQRRVSAEESSRRRKEKRQGQAFSSPSSLVMDEQRTLESHDSNEPSNNSDAVSKVVSVRSGQEELWSVPTLCLTLHPLHLLVHRRTVMKQCGTQNRTRCRRSIVYGKP